MFLAAGELLSEAKSNFWISSGFETFWLTHESVETHVIRTDKPYETIRIQADAPTITLRFHTHAWCGSVFAEQNGHSRILDLYSEEHGYRSFEFTADPSGHIDLVIRTGAPANEGAKDNQIWFVGIDFPISQQWQVRTHNASEYTKLTHGEFGSFLTLSTDTVIGASIVRNGIWAREDVEFFKSIVKPGMVVLDIGANIGHHTVVYSKLVGHDGFVIGFEPQKLIHRIATANLAINGCSNADVIKTALGDKSGIIHLYPISYDSLMNFGALGLDRSTENAKDAPGEEVPLHTVDACLSELYPALERVDFMKIDVQSYEYYVLKGAVETLKKHKPAIFLEIAPHWMKLAGYDYLDVYSMLTELGYVFDHLDGSEVTSSSRKEWSGREGEEWDVYAYVPKS